MFRLNKAFTLLRALRRVFLCNVYSGRFCSFSSLPKCFHRPVWLSFSIIKMLSHRRKSRRLRLKFVNQWFLAHFNCFSGILVLPVNENQTFQNCRAFDVFLWIIFFVIIFRLNKSWTYLIWRFPWLRKLNKHWIP